MCKMTIIIPMYNAENTIVNTIDSLLKQSSLPDEIIIIDDGSTDKSLKLVEEEYSHRKEITILHQMNSGTSVAKNKGIKKASCENIMFVDSDDILESDYIEKHKTYINDVDIVCSGMIINYIETGKKVIINNKENNRPVDSKDLLQLLEKGELFNVDVCKTYKKDILLSNNIFFEESMRTGEDLIFNCKYFKYIRNGILLDYEGYNYIRKSDESLVSVYKEDLFDMAEKCIVARKSLYDYMNVAENTFFLNRMNSTHNSYYLCNIPNLYRKACKLKKTEKISIIKKIKKSLINENFTYSNKQEKLMFHILKYTQGNLTLFIFKILFYLKGKFRILYIKVFYNED